MARFDPPSPSSCPSWSLRKLAITPKSDDVFAGRFAESLGLFAGTALALLFGVVVLLYYLLNILHARR